MILRSLLITATPYRCACRRGHVASQRMFAHVDWLLLLHKCTVSPTIQRFRHDYIPCHLLSSGPVSFLDIRVLSCHSKEMSMGYQRESE